MNLVARRTVTPLKKLSTLHAEPADVALDPPDKAALVRCLLRAGVPAWPVIMLCREPRRSFMKASRLSAWCQQSTFRIRGDVQRCIITHVCPA